MTETREREIQKRIRATAVLDAIVAVILGLLTFGWDPKEHPATSQFVIWGVFLVALFILSTWIMFLLWPIPPEADKSERRA